MGKGSNKLIRYILRILIHKPHHYQKSKFDWFRTSKSCFLDIYYRSEKNENTKSIK